MCVANIGLKEVSRVANPKHSKVRVIISEIMERHKEIDLFLVSQMLALVIWDMLCKQAVKDIQIPT